jgi:hypothetical protein
MIDHRAAPGKVRLFYDKPLTHTNPENFSCIGEARVQQNVGTV